MEKIGLPNIIFIIPLS